MKKASVKIINACQYLKDQFSKSALYNELNEAKRINQSHIIVPCQIVQISNYIYIFYDFQHYGSIQSILRRQRIFKQNQAIRLCTQILTGFYQFIKTGIIFQNLDFSKIFVQQQNVKITGFQLSKSNLSKSRYQFHPNDDICFICPQLIQYKIGQTQKRPGSKTNIWTIGMILYYLVVGNSPWNEIYSLSALQIVNFLREKANPDKISFPEHLNISPQYKDLVRKCLQFQSHNRIDWFEIYQNKIFNEHFVFWKILSPSQIQCIYSLSYFKDSIRRNNYNLSKFLNKFPQNLRDEDFYNITKALDDKIDTVEIANLFSIFSHGNSTLYKNDLIKKLEFYGVPVEGFQEIQIRKLYPKDYNFLLKFKMMLKDAKNIQQFGKWMRQRQYRNTSINLKQFKYNFPIQGKNNLENLDRLWQFLNPFELRNLPFESLIQKICQLTEMPLGIREKTDKQLFKEWILYSQQQVYAFFLQDHIEGVDQDLLIQATKLICQPQTSLASPLSQITNTNTNTKIGRPHSIF